MSSLLNRDQMVAYLAAEGKTNTEIAEVLGIDRSTVAARLADERIQFEIKHLRYKLHGKDHKKRFQDILPRAIDAIEEILTPQNQNLPVKPQLRFAAAQEVMDRALGKPKQTVEHEGSLLRALYEKMDGKKVEPIDVGSERPALTLIENPNEQPPPAVNVSKNPNLSEDPIDTWINKNL